MKPQLGVLCRQDGAEKTPFEPDPGLHIKSPGNREAGSAFATFPDRCPPEVTK